MNPAAPPSASPAATGRAPPGWIAAAVAMLACLLYIAAQQFWALRDRPLQVDELFFSACASRAEVDGWATLAGCHDNKAPLIYLVHGALQRLSGPFDILTLKLASVLLLAAIAVLVAVIARRSLPARPGWAALGAVTLLLAAITPSPALLAVKTELLGMLFVLSAIAGVLRGPITATRSLATGVAMGLALMSKQSFLFLLPAGLWGVWAASAPLPLRRRLGLCGWHALGVVLPLVLLLGLFAAQGRLEELLASLFLYPAVYGATVAAPLAKVLAWRAVRISEYLQYTPVHALLAGVAGLTLSAKPGLTPPQRRLLFACGLALAMMLASPVLFSYHALPFWVLASALGGTVLAEACAAGGRTQAFATAALLAAALFGVGTALRKNSGADDTPPLATALQPGAGRYAYVLGMEPAFYARGFIPASSVQFPWALPGTPGTWAYHPPQPGTRLQAALAAQQQRNLARLYQDFARTPPAYIVTIDLYARAAGSERTADVPGFDDYLARHCEPREPVADSRGHPGRLFSCNPPH